MSSTTTTSQLITDGGIDGALDDQIIAKQSVTRAMKSLSPREVQIIELRFGFNGNSIHTLEQVGKLHHITRMRVWYIEARALRKMRETGQFRSSVDYFEGGVAKHEK